MLVKSFSMAVIAFILVGYARAESSSMLGQSKLIELMQTTKDLQNSNPGRSLECFQYYSQVFDDHLKVYEAEYAECKNNSAAQTAYLNRKYIVIVDNLNDSSSSACQVLSTCSKNEDSLDALACYDSAGSNNTRVMYNISTTASIYHDQLENEIKNVQYVEDTCTSAAKHKYDKNIDEAYIDLQNCLAGLAPVPSEPKTTVTASPTNSEPKTTVTTSSTFSEPKTTVTASSTGSDPKTTVTESSTDSEPKTTVTVSSTNSEPKTTVTVSSTNSEPKTTVTASSTPEVTTIVPPLTLSPDNGNTSSTTKKQNQGIIGDINKIIHAIEHVI